ncbi:MAG: DUF6128 domain-containing protein [Lachnospiraceae bacterium]|nr:DUF6128 domain-containing protein [Lachnospiraceae bacterium]
MYRKEIIYMGLYKKGERMGSAGFLKVENRERESRLHLKIQNVPLGISGRFPVRVHNGSGWKEINGIKVQDGGGSWEEELMEASDGVILQVILPGEYYLEGKSKTADVAKVHEKPDNTKKEENTVQQPDVVKEENAIQQVETAREENAVQQAEIVREENVVQQAGTIAENKAVRWAEEVIETDSKKDTAKQLNRASEEHSELSARSAPAAQKKKPYPETILIKEELPRRAPENTFTTPQNIPEYHLKEDKWEQILDTYDNIHPYGDDRVYVKLEPKDFVILQSKYQHLVNNSFLLHGFYNYRYVILGKEQDGGYYLGVPGVFYEREKMVALMFGFEAFECPSGNVKAGEFGYYLRKVEL